MYSPEFNIDNYRSLFLANNPEKRMESFKVVLDTGMELIAQVHSKIKPQERNVMTMDGLILFQMTMAKGISLSQLMEGVPYKKDVKGGYPLYDLMLLDPMPIASILRMQFEAFSNFYNIYLSSTDKNVQNLLYQLWVVAGLKERQRFVHEDMQEENKLKAAKELNQISSLMAQIQSNPIYGGLSEDERKSFDKRVRKRQFQFQYRNGSMLDGHWRDLFKATGVSDIFDNVYSNLSMSSHPSNVSVFQYAQMFETGSNRETALHYLDMSKHIMAFFIRDYCEFIPLAYDAFQNLPEINQLLVDDLNKSFRGDAYTISLRRAELHGYLQKQYEESSGV